MPTEGSTNPGYSSGTIDQFQLPLQKSGPIPATSKERLTYPYYSQRTFDQSVNPTRNLTNPD